MNKKGNIKNTNKMHYLVLLFILCSLLYSQEIPKRGGSLIIGMPGDIATIYPWEMTDSETFNVFQNIYEPLIRLKKDTADIEPCLAAKWIPTNNNKTWKFYLRKNVYFHDGTLFNADTVINSLSQNKAFTAKMKKINDYLIEFNLDKPNAAFAISLSVEYYAIASPNTVKCYKENCKDLLAIGTGPFKLTNWEPGKRIVLTANENYWNNRPYLDKVVFIPFKNNSEMINALKKKQIHLCSTIKPSNIPEIKKVSYLIFQSRPALSICYLGMNNERKPYTDKKVRNAISYAINKEAIIKKYYLNGQAGSLAKSCIPAPMFGYNKDIPQHEYNPEKAKALLNEAGLKDGFNATMLIPWTSRGYLPEPDAIAEDIKNDLNKIGIKITINKPKNMQTFREISMKGNFDLLLFGWTADTIDPNDFLTALLTTPLINSTNRVRWSNTKFDQLIEKARNENYAIRLKTYEEAQLVFIEEMPFIPIANAMQLAAWNEIVKGFQLHPASRFFLHQVWLAE